MMPDIEREARRKKRTPVIVSILCTGFAASTLLELFAPGWQWVALAVSTVAGTAVGVTVDPIRRRGRGRPGRDTGRRGGGIAGHSHAEADGPAPAYQQRTLATVSRLMPRSTGRRWLAEAESLLWEIEPARRGAAIRSYLRSAPRLAALMWAHEARRRVRPGSRRPG